MFVLFSIISGPIISKSAMGWCTAFFVLHIYLYNVHLLHIFRLITLKEILLSWTTKESMQYFSIEMYY